MGRPEGLHHFLGGVGAGSITLSAHNLALGGKAELSSEVVLSLGGAGVHVLLALAVTVRKLKIKFNLINHKAYEISFHL